LAVPWAGHYLPGRNEEIAQSFRRAAGFTNENKDPVKATPGKSTLPSIPPSIPLASDQAGVSAHRSRRHGAAGCATGIIEVETTGRTS
jgi:hypothetical protein